MPLLSLFSSFNWILVPLNVHSNKKIVVVSGTCVKINPPHQPTLWGLICGWCRCLDTFTSHPLEFWSHSVTLYPRNLCLIIVLSDKHSSTNIGRFLFLSIQPSNIKSSVLIRTELSQSGLYLNKKITNTKSLINHPRYFNVYLREKHPIRNVYFGQRSCALEENPVVIDRIKGHWNCHWIVSLISVRMFTWWTNDYGFTSDWVQCISTKRLRHCLISVRVFTRERFLLQWLSHWVNGP